MKNKSYKSHRTNKWRPSKAFIFRTFSLLYSGCLLSSLWLLWHDTETSKGQSFLLNYFWVRWTGGWIESLNFTSYRNACDALPSAARWKAVHFHAPSKPLTRHEKIWHQSWQKHKGEMNDTIVAAKHQSCSILWKNNAFLFAFQRWQTTLVTGLTLSIPITQNLKQIRIKLWPRC